MRGKGFQAQLAVGRHEQGLERGQAGPGTLQRFLLAGGKHRYPVALHNPQAWIPEHPGCQVDQVHLGTPQPAQYGAHFLQETGIPARFQRDEAQFQQAHGTITRVVSSAFAFAHLEQHGIEFPLIVIEELCTPHLEIIGDADRGFGLEPGEALRQLSKDHGLPPDPRAR